MPVNLDGDLMPVNLDGDLFSLTLSVRARNCLEMGNVRTVRQLCSLELHQLLQIRCLGEKTAMQILKELDRHDLRLGMKEDSKTTLPPMAASLRDWFAGQALTGIFITGPTDGRGCGDDWPSVAAEAAYRAADAMLVARERHD